MTKPRVERLPKCIKIAQQDHYCGSCGGLIKKGDKMTMRMNRGYYPFPICLKCDLEQKACVKTKG